MENILFLSQLYRNSFANKRPFKKTRVTRPRVVKRSIAATVVAVVEINKVATTVFIVATAVHHSYLTPPFVNNI